jgi:hypothetical protein
MIRPLHLQLPLLPQDEEALAAFHDKKISSAFAPSCRIANLVTTFTNPRTYTGISGCDFPKQPACFFPNCSLVDAYLVDKEWERCAVQADVT